MIVFYHLFLVTMEYLSIITEIIENITLLYCFTTYVHKLENKVRIASVFLIFILTILKFLLFSNYIINYFLELLIIAVFIIICFPKRKLWYFMTIFTLSTILSFARLLVGILTFPIAVVAKIEVDGLGSEILIGIFCVLSYLVIMCFSQKRSLKNQKEPSVITKVVVALLLGFSECILLTIRHIGYNNEYTMIYNVLLFTIVFSVIVLMLWLFDKSQEQKKIQELTAYAHRTREVIPSMSRMLNELEKQSEYEDKTGEIIRELKLICDGDMSKTRRGHLL